MQPCCGLVRGWLPARSHQAISSPAATVLPPAAMTPQAAVPTSLRGEARLDFWRGIAAIQAAQPRRRSQSACGQPASATTNAPPECALPCEQSLTGAAREDDGVGFVGAHGLGL